MSNGPPPPQASTPAHPSHRGTAPVVSVCIANYNGVAFLRECIDSVLAQQGAPSFEIIVHDDASTDASIALIQDYPEVRLLRSPGNVGFCVSNNRMAAAANGQYLLLLNNDAMLFPDALRALHDSATADSRDPVLSPPQFDHASGALLDRGLCLDLFANPVPVTHAGEPELAMVMGACLWISARLWQELDGFPEWMGSIGEDLYLCCHARLAGHPVAVTRESGYRHRVGSSFGGGKAHANRLNTTVRRRSLSERNKTFVMLTFYPGALLLPLLPLHFALLLAEGIVLATLNRNRRIFTEIYLGAIAAAWRQRNTLRQARRQVRNNRRLAWAAFLRPMLNLPRKLQLLLKFGIPSIR